MVNDANRLRQLRIAEGLTVAELSRYAGINEKTIRDIEKGRRQGSEVTKWKILNGLNKNPRKSKVWQYNEIFET
jgi:transcriptional regulator with XRE-family HTH domain